MELYQNELTPTSRAVFLCAKALGIDLKLIRIDIKTRENRGEEYAKINFRKVVPTLKDGDFILGESRAIMAYLVETYEKDDSLYPKDPKSRARVNELLYFDACTLYQRFMDYYYPQVFFGTPPEPIREVRFQESLEFLETFLENNEWACGGNLTIADFALVGSVASFDVSCGVDLSKFPNILRWYENCQKNMLGYEFNQEGAEKFKVFFSRIKK